MMSGFHIESLPPEWFTTSARLLSNVVEELTIAGVSLFFEEPLRLPPQAHKNHMSTRG